MVSFSDRSLTVTGLEFWLIHYRLWMSVSDQVQIDGRWRFYALGSRDREEPQKAFACAKQYADCEKTLLKEWRPRAGGKNENDAQCARHRLLFTCISHGTSSIVRGDLP